MKRFSFIFLSLLLLLFAVSCHKQAIPTLAGAIEAGKADVLAISEPREARPVPEPENKPVQPTPATESPSIAQTPEPSSTSSPEQEPDAEEGYTGYERLIPDEYKNLPYYYPGKAKRYIEYSILNPDLEFEKAILNVNIGLDIPFYSDIRIIAEPDRIDVLVNKYHKIPDDYEPVLEELPAELCAKKGEMQYLRSEAKEAFERMHRDALELGLNITAFGTYRSIRLQYDIWNYKVNLGRSIEDVDRLNSRGGHSEHHTGLAVDVIKNSYMVEDTEEFEWYKDNAHKYGFIIRYPKGKEHITGYKYEPWHLRYLGEELATNIYESGLTYEEYYAVHIEPYLKNRPN